MILVYDVICWGSFQGAAEFADYEFVCKSLGVPTHFADSPQQELNATVTPVAGNPPTPFVVTKPKEQWLEERSIPIELLKMWK